MTERSGDNHGHYTGESLWTYMSEEGEATMVGEDDSVHKPSEAMDMAKGRELDGDMQSSYDGNEGSSIEELRALNFCFPIEGHELAKGMDCILLSEEGQRDETS